MKQNYGKKFEERFKHDWMRTYPNQFILRLKDSTSGYYGASRNPCDFLALVDGTLFMIEVKCHYGNTFPFQDLRQYDILTTYLGLKNVQIGVVIWFIDHQQVIYVPLETVKKMKEDGLKSINMRKLDGYDVIYVQSQVKRVFLESDYSFMREISNESKNKEIKS